ncbi:MAG: hypothetical protein AAFO95_22845 [Cyanobacteria bacterium J06600_6]
MTRVNASDFEGMVKVPQSSVGVFESIVRELMRAETKHPDWPTDPIHAGAIVSEEAGELIRECLQISYEEGDKKLAAKEAIQTAVTAIRFLQNLDSYELQ